MLSKRDLPIIRVKSNETGRTDLNLRTLKDVRQNAERKHIQQILMNCGNNISEAAKVLDISRRQLYNKIYEYNIEI